MYDIRVLSSQTGGIDQATARQWIEAALGRAPANAVATNYIWVLMWVISCFVRLGAYSGHQGRVSHQLGHRRALLCSRLPTGRARLQNPPHLFRGWKRLLQEWEGTIREEGGEPRRLDATMRESWVGLIFVEDLAFSPTKSCWSCSRWIKVVLRNYRCIKNNDLGGSVIYWPTTLSLILFCT